MVNHTAPAGRRDPLVWLVAGGYILLQLLVSERYGYFRDELYYLACGSHLAWGYVDHPPVIAIIARLTQALFGTSLFAIRFLSALAGGATIVLAGRLARTFGGKRWATVVAALAVAIAPMLQFTFHILSMNAWDVLLWTTVAYMVARILLEDSPRLWLAVGLLVGLGLETKYTMGLLVLGLGAGFVFTSARRNLLDWQLWAGAVMAAVIAAPHVWWQASNGWPTLEFIRNATTLKNADSPWWQFLGEQVSQLHPLNAVLLVAGLVFFFRGGRGRFRPFGWAYLTVFLVVLSRQGKPYYLAPIYPLMLAGGSVAIEHVLAARHIWRRTVVAAMLLTGVVTTPFALPVLPVATYIAYADVLGFKPSSGERQEIGELPQHYADMFGWDSIVATVARVYQSLPADDQARVGIFVPNYGDAGAIDLLGPRLGLHKHAISPHNNYYLWGPGDVSGEILIVVGGELADHQKSYADVRVVDQIDCGRCMPYENHRPVYVVRKPLRSMDEIWRSAKKFI